jgi:hypothetical protein
MDFGIVSVFIPATGAKSDGPAEAGAVSFCTADKLPMTPENRPQDPNMDGAGLRFETLDHGGECPDTMSQAIN